jgi:indolepyruvate ferredoxin oxidoreductase beta subunit
MNILLAGIGGQGTILAARLIGGAALASGLSVRGSETIGMAQRGGSVISHLRIGERALSPLIMPGAADAILAFELGEAVRCARYLAKNGIMIASSLPLYADYDAESAKAWLRDNTRLRLIDGERVSREFGIRILNMVLIGFGVGSCALDIGGVETVEAVLKTRLPEKHWHVNIKALQAGFEWAKALNGDKNGLF